MNLSHFVKIKQVLFYYILKMLLSQLNNQLKFQIFNDLTFTLKSESN
jgi:hypothetical protein